MRKHIAPLIVVLLLASTAIADRVVKRPDNATVYLQRDNVLYAIPNARTFECMGFDWNRIAVLNDKEWSRLSVGSRLPGLEDNALVKGSSSAVYLMTNCQRRHIPDMQTFNSMRLNWNAVQTAPDWMLKLVKEGNTYPSVNVASVSGQGSDPKEKAKKVECVFTRPHIALDNRLGRAVVFRLSGNFSLEGNPDGKCENVTRSNGFAQITVAAKSECKVILTKEEGNIISRIDVVDGRTYVSNGNWDVFGCCRNTPARYDAGEDGTQGGWQAALNDAIRSGKYNGTAWRAYRAAYDSGGLNVWTRDKDSNIPFSARTGWESLEFKPGTCQGN